MNEPITPAPTDEATELATLRRVNAELVAKSATRKTRVTELEATVTELQGKLTVSATAIHDLTVGGPLRAMAESISIAPELFLEQFKKSYRVELVKGQLTLQTTDGKPVMKGEKPVPFEQKALLELLTVGDDGQAKIFKSIAIASRASGAGSSGAGRQERSTSQTKPTTLQFGLR